MTNSVPTVDCTNPDCGIPVDPSELTCPKCDTDLHNALSEQFYEIDVAHNGQTREEAKVEIEEGLNTALLYRFRGLRVIHGYGSGSSKRGPLPERPLVSWKHSLRARATVSGRMDSTEAHI